MFLLPVSPPVQTRSLYSPPVFAEQGWQQVSQYWLPCPPLALGVSHVQSVQT